MGAIKGLGKAYQLYNKLKKAGVVKKEAKASDIKKVLESGKTKASDISKSVKDRNISSDKAFKIGNQKMGGKTSEAGNVPTKKKLEFGKGAKGVTVKPSGGKTLTKEYLKKLEIKKNLSKK